jgi:putative SOS response-associated peptidase YedK
VAGGPKRPYFVRARRDAAGTAPPLAFAGLYETWTGPNGEELDTAAIVTTAANRTLSAIHERMPVFVPRDGFALWLDCANVEADVAAALIAPASEALLEAYEISPAVNRVANDADALIMPFSAPDGTDVQPDSAPASTKKKAKKTREPDDQASLF